MGEKVLVRDVSDRLRIGGRLPSCGWIRYVRPTRVTGKQRIYNSVCEGFELEFALKYTCTC